MSHTSSHTERVVLETGYQLNVHDRMNLIFLMFCHEVSMMHHAISLSFLEGTSSVFIVMG